LAFVRARFRHAKKNASRRSSACAVLAQAFANADYNSPAQATRPFGGSELQLRHKNPREALTFRAAFSREPSSTSTTTARVSLTAVSFRQGTASPVPKTTQHERLQPLRSAFFLF
jgi:hypothetical protein